METWGRHYNGLVDRFEHIIRGQFFGHTHDDVISVTRGTFSGDPTGIIFMPGSLTTYQNKNPSFRIYDVDPTTMLITNYANYRLNVTEANKNQNE